jgi:hypothetical protein
MADKYGMPDENDIERNRIWQAEHDILLSELGDAPVSEEKPYRHVDRIAELETTLTVCLAFLDGWSFDPKYPLADSDARRQKAEANATRDLIRKVCGIEPV